MTERHLDDEALSAVLDGEATDDDALHADGCGVCGARLAALREATLLVRTPVAPASDAEREAAIAAAMAAAPATVVPFRSRRRTMPAWLGAAAAVVVAAGSVALLAQRGDDDDRGDQSTALESSDAFDEDAMATLAAPPTVDGGDIGAVEDLDLRAVVEAGTAARASVSGTGGDAGPAAGGGAESSADDGAPACEDEVRAGDPELGPLLFRAVGTYDDEAVTVLAFEAATEEGGLDRRVYVVATDGCAIRTFLTFSA